MSELNSLGTILKKSVNANDKRAFVDSTNGLAPNLVHAQDAAMLNASKLMEPFPLRLHPADMQELKEWLMQMIDRSPTAVVPEPEPAPKVNHHASVVAYGDRLRDMGWSMLASGHYSSVWEHPKSDKVIKVNRAEDGWLDFVKWASTIKSDVFIKVYSIRQHDGFNVALCEKIYGTHDKATRRYAEEAAYKKYPHVEEAMNW